MKFFNEYNFCINSILELDFDKTPLLSTWLTGKGYSRHNDAPPLFRGMYRFYLRWYDTRDEYNKEVWDLRRMYPESEHPLIRLRYCEMLRGKKIYNKLNYSKGELLK